MKVLVSLSSAKIPSDILPALDGDGSKGMGEVSFRKLPSKHQKKIRQDLQEAEDAWRAMEKVRNLAEMFGQVRSPKVNDILAKCAMTLENLNYAQAEKCVKALGLNPKKFVMSPTTVSKAPKKR